MAVAGSGSSALELKVTKDSWFSVRQKDGKEVFSGLVHGGDVQRVLVVATATPFCAIEA